MYRLYHRLCQFCFISRCTHTRYKAKISKKINAMWTIRVLFYDSHKLFLIPFSLPIQNKPRNFWGILRWPPKGGRNIHGSREDNRRSERGREWVRARERKPGLRVSVGGEGGLWRGKSNPPRALRTSPFTSQMFPQTLSVGCGPRRVESQYGLKLDFFFFVFLLFLDCVCLHCNM